MHSTVLFIVAQCAISLALFYVAPAIGTVLEEVVSGKGATFSLEDAMQSGLEGEERTFWELQVREQYNTEVYSTI